MPNRDPNPVAGDAVPSDADLPPFPPAQLWADSMKLEPGPLGLPVTNRHITVNYQKTAVHDQPLYTDEDMRVYGESVARELAAQAGEAALAPQQQAGDVCGACSDGCADRGSCRVRDESPKAAPGAVDYVELAKAVRAEFAKLHETMGRINTLASRPEAVDAAMVERARGPLPAKIENPEAWPPNYADGFNDCVQLFTDELPAALEAALTAPASAQEDKG